MQKGPLLREKCRWPPRGFPRPRYLARKPAVGRGRSRGGRARLPRRAAGLSPPPPHARRRPAVLFLRSPSGRTRRGRRRETRVRFRPVSGKRKTEPDPPRPGSLLPRGGKKKRRPPRPRCPPPPPFPSDENPIMILPDMPCAFPFPARIRAASNPRPSPILPACPVPTHSLSLVDPKRSSLCATVSTSDSRAPRGASYSPRSPVLLPLSPPSLPRRPSRRGLASWGFGGLSVVPESRSSCSPGPSLLPRLVWKDDNAIERAGNEKIAVGVVHGGLPTGEKQGDVTDFAVRTGVLWQNETRRRNKRHLLETEKRSQSLGNHGTSTRGSRMPSCRKMVFPDRVSGRVFLWPIRSVKPLRPGEKLGVRGVG